MTERRTRTIGFTGSGSKGPRPMATPSCHWPGALFACAEQALHSMPGVAHPPQSNGNWQLPLVRGP